MTDCFLVDDDSRDPSLSPGGNPARPERPRDFLFRVRESRLATLIPRLVLFLDRIAASRVYTLNEGRRGQARSTFRANDRSRSHLAPRSIGFESIRSELRCRSAVNLLPRCKHREDTHRRICN
jgi:hypothetical protein